MLTYRERFARTLAHTEVDRPPLDLNATDMTGIVGGPRRLAPLLGLPTTGPGEEVDEAVLRALDVDLRDVGGVLAPANTQARRISDTEFVDAWGIGYRFTGHHWEHVHRPLAGATIDGLDRYPWPDPEQIDREQIALLREKARRLFEQTPYVVCARHPYFGVFELGCWMCGFEDFLARLAADQEFVHRFFSRFLRYQRRVDEVYYGALGPFIHFTTSGDDFGTQHAPFMSPGMFRELIAPYLKERIRHIKSFTDAAFFHHSCGAIHPLIPDLIDAGVVILNPIQPRAALMEPDRLKRDFGGQLTFYGGVDTQILLPTGTPEEVGEATRDLIRALGAGGGFILSAAHTLQEDVPDENILAMYRAATSG